MNEANEKLLCVKYGDRNGKLSKDAHPCAADVFWLIEQVKKYQNLHAKMTVYAQQVEHKLKTAEAEVGEVFFELSWRYTRWYLDIREIRDGLNRRPDRKRGETKTELTAYKRELDYKLRFIYEEVVNHTLTWRALEEQKS